MADDRLGAALEALADEISAVDSFDRARDVVVDLIEIRADVEAVYQALDEVYDRLAAIRTSYYALEALMITNGWSMERPNELPQALRAALEDEVAHHQEHLARTAEVERVVGFWLGEEAWQHATQRYRATRRFSERAHSHRARRRRRGKGDG
jgi:hypothetical protein